ncbi:MAG: long-chain fatty acid--CoA ligase, partial [Cyclobacteriaceae bacterium]|nr:long-chain fatty acid--CoA ligase [Cyclobacteriaceae bacterium]
NNFTRIFDVLTYQQDKYPNNKALNAFVKGNWKAYSIDEIKKRSQSIACWFIQNGFTKGEKIILVPVAGSPEWMIIDFACQQAGLIVVPVHPTSHSNEVEVVLKDTKARLFIVADTDLYNTFSEVVKRLDENCKLYHLDPENQGYFSPVELANVSDKDLKSLAEISNSITEDDILTIMYTSGSSGVPKGVMLSHRNVASGIKAMLTLLPLEPKHRVMSFLPFSHIFERVSCYGYLAFGVSVYFNQRAENFSNDFNSVKPYFCTSVPRVLEKMYDFMLEKSLKQNFVKRKVVTWAMEVGKQYQPGALGFWLSLELAVARMLVLNQWRKKLGGKIRYMVVGAASLRPEIGKLFSAAGLFVVEGYGMTETAPIISVNRFDPGMNHFGTVGLPIPTVDIKIDQPNEEGEGEILVKGPNVMKGYYLRPELDQEVFTEDGWFKTGDIGKLVEKGFLKITDRKKDIFKTSSGKYIAPQQLQNHFCRSLFIQRCLILGFQQSFVTALIVPNFLILESWCTKEGIHWTSPQFMVYNIKVRAKLQEEIEILNEELANYQRVRNFVLCHQDWTIEAGELTTTLKPVRRLLMEHYQKEIDKMYSE